MFGESIAETFTIMFTRLSSYLGEVLKNSATSIVRIISPTSSTAVYHYFLT